MSTLEILKQQGFDLSYREDEYIHVQCSQCEALVIQGTACHETGCPNKKEVKRGFLQEK
jgi:hypothetical protein